MKPHKAWAAVSKSNGKIVEIFLHTPLHRVKDYLHGFKNIKIVRVLIYAESARLPSDHKP